MIELGLVLLIQGNPAVAAIAAQGGFFSSVAKDQPLPTWSYTTVTDDPDYLLTGPEGITTRRFQIDCYGAIAADAIKLANAIDAVMNGFRGSLSDSPPTFVQGSFRNMVQDFYDDGSRTFRRMLEYNIVF